MQRALYAIFCDEIDCDVQTEEYSSAYNAREAARATGWERESGLDAALILDRCPDCVKRAYREGLKRDIEDLGHQITEVRAKLAATRSL